jgi:zinc transport system substrate-binding protein
MHACCYRIAAIALLLALAPRPAYAELRVVASIKPVHALVAEIMHGIGTPGLLVDGNASPHTYALKPSDARAINAADVFVRVSESLEPFTAKVIRSIPRSVTVLTLADAPGLKLLSKRTSPMFERHVHARKGHGHDHGTEKDIHDGHIWLDPSNAKAMAKAIAAALTGRAPAEADKIKANIARLEARLDALTAELERELKPVADKPFIVFHDAYQYFEARFGLNAVGSITLSPEAQPSAKRIAEVRAKIAGLGAVCVFAEPQFRSKLLDSVTEGTKAKAGTLDPEGALVPAGPDHYVTLMRSLAQGLKSCLGSA